jgi:phytoene synthase
MAKGKVSAVDEVEPPASLACAFAAARQICRSRSRGLFFAYSFLPHRKRDAACALFAFRRMIDDVLDAPQEQANAGCCGGGDSDATIGLLRQRIDEVYGGSLDLPDASERTSEQNVLVAIMHVVRKFEVPRSCFVDLVNARQAERAVTRYPTWNRLESHCQQLEGSFALATCCVLGMTHSDAQRHAIAFGTALRLTQVLRDVKRDWARRRIYLPLEDMARFRYSERELAAGVVNEQFRELMKFEIARARELYRDAAAGLRWLADDGSRLAAAIILVMNEGILDAIAANGYDVFSHRATLSVGRKMVLAPRAWALARGD